MRASSDATISKTTTAVLTARGRLKKRPYDLEKMGEFKQGSKVISDGHARNPIQRTGRARGRSSADVAGVAIDRRRATRRPRRKDGPEHGPVAPLYARRVAHRPRARRRNHCQSGA